MEKKLIYEKMKRSFPKNDFPDRALALISRFKVGISNLEIYFFD